MNNRHYQYAGGAGAGVGGFQQSRPIGGSAGSMGSNSAPAPVIYKSQQQQHQQYPPAAAAAPPHHLQQQQQQQQQYQQANNEAKRFKPDNHSPPGLPPGSAPSAARHHQQPQSNRPTFYLTNQQIQMLQYYNSQANLTPQQVRHKSELQHNYNMMQQHIHMTQQQQQQQPQQQQPQPQPQPQQQQQQQHQQQQQQQQQQQHHQQHQQVPQARSYGPPPSNIHVVPPNSGYNNNHNNNSYNGIEHPEGLLQRGLQRVRHPQPGGGMVVSKCGQVSTSALATTNKPQPLNDTKIQQISPTQQNFNGRIIMDPNTSNRIAYPPQNSSGPPFNPNNRNNGSCLPPKPYQAMNGFKNDGAISSTTNGRHVGIHASMSGHVSVPSASPPKSNNEIRYMQATSSTNCIKSESKISPVSFPQVDININFTDAHFRQEYPPSSSSSSANKGLNTTVQNVMNNSATNINPRFPSATIPSTFNNNNRSNGLRFNINNTLPTKNGNMPHNSVVGNGMRSPNDFMNYGSNGVLVQAMNNNPQCPPVRGVMASMNRTMIGHNNTIGRKIDSTGGHVDSLGSTVSTQDCHVGIQSSTFGTTSSHGGNPNHTVGNPGCLVGIPSSTVRTSVSPGSVVRTPSCHVSNPNKIVGTPGYHMGIPNSTVRTPVSPISPVSNLNKTVGTSGCHVGTPGSTVRSPGCLISTPGSSTSTTYSISGCKPSNVPVIMVKNTNVVSSICSGVNKNSNPVFNLAERKQEGFESKCNSNIEVCLAPASSTNGERIKSPIISPLTNSADNVRSILQSLEACDSSKSDVKNMNNIAGSSTSFTTSTFDNKEKKPLTMSENNQVSKLGPECLEKLENVVGLTTTASTISTQSIVANNIIGSTETKADMEPDPKSPAKVPEVSDKELTDIICHRDFTSSLAEDLLNRIAQSEDGVKKVNGTSPTYSTAPTSHGKVPTHSNGLVQPPSRSPGTTTGVTTTMPNFVPIKQEPNFVPIKQELLDTKPIFITPAAVKQEFKDIKRSPIKLEVDTKCRVKLDSKICSKPQKKPHKANSTTTPARAPTLWGGPFKKEHPSPKDGEIKFDPNDRLGFDDRKMSEPQFTVDDSADEIEEGCVGRGDITRNFNMLNDEDEPPKPPIPPSAKLTREQLLPPTPSVLVDNKKVAFSPQLQEFCLQHPIAVVRGLAQACKIDLGLYSTKTLVEAHPEHNVEVRTQIRQDPDENVDHNTEETVWPCTSHRSHTTVAKYAQYQASSFQDHLEDEKAKQAIAQKSNGKKVRETIKFGTNVDLSNEKKWKPQLEELMKLPAFMRLVSAGNMLSHVGHDILGMNTVQLYMKVPGSRTPGHQENNNFCAINFNIGPEDVEWFAVPDAYWGRIDELCRKNGTNYLHGSWWPDIQELYDENIPVYRFHQKPGDLVWVNAGCVHWVQAVGWCNNIAWNVGPMTARQFQLSLERYEWNKIEEYKSIVPVVNLTWSLARNIRFSDVKLYDLIKATLVRSLRQVMLSLDFVKQCGKEPRFHGHMLNEPTHYCETCEFEVFNVLFVKEQSGRHIVYCVDCARRDQPKLEKYVVLEEYHIKDLKETYDTFVLHSVQVTKLPVQEST